VFPAKEGKKGGAKKKEGGTDEGGIGKKGKKEGGDIFFLRGFNAGLQTRDWERSCPKGVVWVPSNGEKKVG